MENLRYKSIFDIIGPIMIGPSSSHTAGACRIGKIVRSIFGELPDKIDIHLYESFAKTYRGHGTDKAIVGGLLDMYPDDPRLPNALAIAADLNLDISFIVHTEERAEHPNTARLVVKKGTHEMSVTGISIGGGSILVSELNGFTVSLTMGMPTFVIVHRDVPGVIAKVTTCFSNSHINIAQMNVTREARGEKAIMIIEVDSKDIEEAFIEIKKIPNLDNVNFFV